MKEVTDLILIDEFHSALLQRGVPKPLPIWVTHSGNVRIITSVGYLFQDYLSGLTQVGNIFHPGNNLVYGV